MFRAALVFLVLALPIEALAQGRTGPSQQINRVLSCPDNPTDAPARMDFDETKCVETAVGDLDPQGRAIWVRARVTLEEARSSPRAVYVSAMASSEIYWNGRFIGANGRPASLAANERAGLIDAAFHLPEDLVTPGENLLAIRMSAHDMPVRVTTPVHWLAVGPFGALRPMFFRYYQPVLIASGAILFAGAFFFAGFLLDRRETSALWLSLMALFAVSQLGVEAARGLSEYPYTAHVPRLMAIVFFAGLFSIALVGFVNARFKSARPWRWLLATALLSVACAFLVKPFDLKTVLVLSAGGGVALASVALPARRGAPGARITALALLAFLALLILRPTEFLDRYFYLVVTALLGVLCVDQAFAMRRDRIARETAQRRSAHLEVELLRKGLAPHFMLNTLNSLAEWVEADPARSVAMIEALGNHLRNLAALGDRDAIPLIEEIDLVRNYLRVMSFRVDAQFTLDVAGDVSGVRTPAGVLHTLAENAFTHNRYPEGGAFRLDVKSLDGCVRLTFETPPSSQRRDGGQGGAGRGYVRGRLADTFGDTARFADGPHEAGTWRSVLELPMSAR